MMRWIVLSLVLATTAFAQPSTHPAIALDANSTVDQVLDALHARGEGLKDFSADVAMASIDALSGDTTTLFGQVWFQSPGEGQGRLRASFPRKKVGQREQTDAKMEYLLDKGWLVERDYKRKLQVDRQVLKPGQKINLLKLGEGPFPLPIGQPREEVLKAFNVTKVAPKADDPANTVHIQLIPKPKTQFERKFKSIDVWVSTQDNFPRRIETTDKRETEIRQTDLSNMRINAGLTDATFALEKVEGWKMHTEGYEE